MELERDAATEQSLAEMEAEHQSAILLEKQVEELKQNLQIAETQYKEKVGGLMHAFTQFHRSIVI